jgi:hypothetical protein
MPDTRRLFVKKAFNTGAGLIAAPYLPNTAYAGCASVTHDYNLLQQVGQPIPGRKVGDCEIKGMTLTVLPGAISLFNAQVCTHFTHKKDVWHMRLRILSKLVAKPEQLIPGSIRLSTGPKC